MANLFYFKWYPKDAETDELYVSMSNEELGFYHRLLNQSWINDGLPADLNDLASLMHLSRRALEKLWKPKVCRCWVEQSGRLFNMRQEEERSQAVKKSKACSGAVKTRYGKPTNVDSDVGTNTPPTNYESPTTHTPRALARADCDSDSVFCFPDFLAAFPRKSNRARMQQAWSEVVHSEALDLVKMCLERYLASDEVSRGVVMNGERWLYEQAANQWSGDWPAAQISHAKRFTAANISALPAADPRDEIAAIRSLIDDENESESVKETLRKRLAELEREAS